jgi:5-methylcytosine-specific restriction enzyme A
VRYRAQTRHVPSAPSRLCRQCRQCVIPGGAIVCAACAPQVAACRESRPALSARGWYHTSQWAAVRRRVLAESPLCVSCRRPANTVDHIEPHRMDESLFWARSNLQTLCASCHSRKTAREDGGFGNRRTA